MRRRLNLVRKNTAELARGLVMLLLLRPASDWLPRSLARGLAQLVGLLIALSPTRGRSTYLSMLRAFGFSKSQAFWASQQWLARPFLDFVVTRRILNNREDWARWKVQEIGSELAKQIKDSGQPFILATGHFARESFLHLFLPAVLPHRIGFVAAPLPPWSRNPFIFRMRLQYGQLLNALRHVRPDDLDLLFTGGAFSKMLERLGRRDNIVTIAVDAYWMGGGPYLGQDLTSAPKKSTGQYSRSFAGLLVYRIVIGAAAVSRLTQCPILPCSMFQRADGTVVIEWGTPISPPERKDQDADVRVMNQLLNFIERAVGSRPTQYVSEIGASRRWNASRSEWEDRL